MKSMTWQTGSNMPMISLFPRSRPYLRQTLTSHLRPPLLTNRVGLEGRAQESKGEEKEERAQVGEWGHGS